jgi:hypothetical protein
VPAEVCCCGNVLRDDRAAAMRVSPCRCDSPGDGSSVLQHPRGIPDEVYEKQYNQRRRLGLPIVTPFEEATLREGY